MNPLLVGPQEAHERTYRSLLRAASRRSRSSRARVSVVASTSHSQSRTTMKPADCANSVERMSRSRLRRIFSTHRGAFGPENS